MKTKNPLHQVVRSQYLRLMSQVRSAGDQNDLETIQKTLDSVSSLWIAIGYRDNLNHLRKLLRKRAATLLLQNQDQLALYQPGKGLWQSALRTVQGLAAIASN